MICGDDGLEPVSFYYSPTVCGRAKQLRNPQQGTVYLPRCSISHYFLSIHSTFSLCWADLYSEVTAPVSAVRSPARVELGLHSLRSKVTPQGESISTCTPWLLPRHTIYTGEGLPVPEICKRCALSVPTVRQKCPHSMHSMHLPWSRGAFNMLARFTRRKSLAAPQLSFRYTARGP